MIEGGVIAFVRADHIGRPVFATNASGVKTWTATYTPFGGVHTSTGAPPSARFPGQWFQSESGLHQNWMRDYDPTTGRYLQADPLGLVDGASVYGYVGQSPMRHVDPKGEQLAGVVGGWIAGDAAIPDPTDAAWPKWVTYGALLGGAMILDYCTSCPACSPYPAGTVGYIGPHTNHTHYPYKDHYNLSRVLQDPNTCKCYWRKNKPDSAPYPPPADPSWVDLNPGFPVLSP